MAAKKKPATGNIEARLAALRADIEALQTDMKGLYGDVSEVASERAALAMRSAEEIADRAVALAGTAQPCPRPAHPVAADRRRHWRFSGRDLPAAVISLLNLAGV